MSDKLDLLGQALSIAILRANSILVATEIQQFIALATLVVALLTSAHVARQTWRRLKEIGSARQVVARLNGPSAFARHFEATSARLLALPSIKNGWERFARSRVSTREPATGVHLTFSIAPAKIFTRSTIMPEWQHLDRLPFTFLSAALIAAIVGLAGSLTQLLVANPDPSMAATYSRLAAQQLANGGRASFTIIIAGIASCTVMHLMLRLCWKRIDLALASLIDDLDQRISIQSLDELRQNEAAHRPEHGELQSNEALSSAQVSLLHSHIDASVARVETSLKKAIHQAIATIVQRFDTTAPTAAHSTGTKALEACATTSLELTFDRALSKFRDDITRPIDTSIRALDERISSPLTETLGKLAALTDSLAGARSEISTTTSEMKSRIANAAEAIGEFRQQQSQLAQEHAATRRSVTAALADLDRRIPTSGQLLEIERAIHSPITHINSSLHQIREDVAVTGSAYLAISTALDNRLRTELASLRLAVQLQNHDREVAQERAVEKMQTSLDSRIEEKISRPLAELATSVSDIAGVTKQSAIEIARLDRSIEAASSDVTQKVGAGLGQIDASLATISNDLKWAADSQSEHQKLAAEATAALTTMNQVAAGIAQGSHEATAQLMRTTTIEQERLRHDIAQTIKSIQTAGELTRIKLEEAVSNLTRSAFMEIEQLTSGVASGGAVREATDAKQIAELKDQVTAAIFEFKSLTSSFDQPFRAIATEVRTLVESAKSQLDGASTELRRVSKIAADETRETLDRLGQKSSAEFAARVDRLELLADCTAKDHQTMLGLTRQPKSIDVPPEAPQSAATTQIGDFDTSPADQLERTLSALSNDLRKARSIMAAADASNSTDARSKLSERRFRGPSQHSSQTRPDLTSKPAAAEREVAKDEAIEQTISQFFNNRRTGKQTAK